jgi:hypothetical protein
MISGLPDVARGLGIMSLIEEFARALEANVLNSIDLLASCVVAGVLVTGLVVAALRAS